MYQREPMSIYFTGRDWKPNAVKVGVGGILSENDVRPSVSVCSATVHLATNRLQTVGG